MSKVLAAILGLALVSPTLQAQSKSARTGPVWPDEGPATWAPRPTAAAITANDLRTRLYQFADDSMQGRRIGELGNWKGTEYIAREFKRLGLKPAGDNGTYFQVLPFGPAGFDRGESRLMVGGATLTPESDWIPLTGFGSQFTANGTEVVFAGPWSAAGNADPAIWRGKIAVFLGTPAVGGFGGGRGGAEPVSCDALPDRFGARMAAYTDSVAAANRGQAGRPNRGGPVASGPRPDVSGAAGVFFVGLESLPPATVGSAFSTRNMMEPAARSGPGGAALSTAAAARLFDKPLDQLQVGEVASP
ncbi:MAG: hypothetical protein R2882_13525 [Gemmatimonadales bacterium]